MMVQPAARFGQCSKSVDEMRVEWSGGREMMSRVVVQEDNGVVALWYRCGATIAMTMRAVYRCG